jgi:hypothetical protein
VEASEKRRLGDDLCDTPLTRSVLTTRHEFVDRAVALQPLLRDHNGAGELFRPVPEVVIEALTAAVTVPTETVVLEPL